MVKFATSSPAYNWRVTTILTRTHDTWTTYAHELGHDQGFMPHSSAPWDSHAMHTYGDEAMMGSREGKTDFNAASRCGSSAELKLRPCWRNTGILKPLNVEARNGRSSCSSRSVPSAGQRRDKAGTKRRHAHRLVPR